RRIDHLHRRLMTGGQRIHDMILNACPPPTNEAILAGCAGTIGSGRSRQGAPERKTQKMPFRTRRSSTRGMPRGLFGGIGLIAAHSASLSSYSVIQAPFRSLNHASGDAINM